MKKLFFLFIGLGLFSLTPFASFGQTDTIPKKNENYFWVNTASHITFSDNFDFMIGIQMGLNLSVNQKRFFQLKAYGLLSPNELPMPSPRADEMTSLANISALYGLGHYRTKSFIIIASAGLSFGKANYRGKYLYTEHTGSSWNSSNTRVYDHDNYNYIGIPLNISFMFTSPFVGLSIDLYANIHKHPEYGVTINTHFGKIRDKK